MASTYSKKFRAAAVAGASALTLGGTALMAAPAQATTGLVDYSCQVPIVGAKTFQVEVDSDAPATLAAGTSKDLKGTAKVIVPGDLAGLMGGVLKATTIKGTAKVDTSLDGAAQSSTFAIADTPVPASGDMTVNASGPLYTVTAGAAGTTHTIVANSFTADMYLYNAAGAEVGHFEIPCTPGTPPTVDTITASAAAAATKTTVKAKYVKAKKTVQANVAVKGTKTGKVAVQLKLGKKVVKKATVKLKNGKAVAKFAKIKKKGKYTVIAKLAAGKGYKASTGKTTVKVK